MLRQERLWLSWVHPAAQKTDYSQKYIYIIKQKLRANTPMILPYTLCPEKRDQNIFL